MEEAQATPLQSLFSVSFMPNGDWFIFRNSTGLTAFAGFRTRKSAFLYLIHNVGEFRL